MDLLNGFLNILNTVQTQIIFRIMKERVIVKTKDNKFMLCCCFSMKLYCKNKKIRKNEKPNFQTSIRNPVTEE